jgi:hypothetical protein
MKKLGLFVTALVILGFASCDLNQYTEFEMDFTTSVTVPASSGITLPFDLFTPETTTNAETTFGNNDTNKELIQEIIMKQMTMDITAPGDRDFDFLKEIRIYINADGLSELEIASKTDIPADVDMITLDVNSNDIKEYIKKDKFQLRVKTVTDEVLSNDVNIDVYTKFAVDAEVLGV